MCVDKALLSNMKNTVRAKLWLKKCYLGSTQSETTVQRWYVNFKPSHTDTNDAECSGCPTRRLIGHEDFGILKKNNIT